MELHCHTNFSMLDGASHPEDVVARAKELGMSALAITDHAGLYGVVRFAKACKEAGIKPIIGAEMTLHKGFHVVLLARNAAGYANLSRLISHAQLTGTKGDARLDFAVLARNRAGLICLSGCQNGEIASHLLANRKDEAMKAARKYLSVFGRENFWIELQNHRLPRDKKLCAELIGLAKQIGVRCMATNDVHYATPKGRRLQDILVCIKTHTTLEQGHPLRRPNAEFYLKSAAEMSALFAQYPDAVRNTARIAERCDVDLFAPSMWGAEGAGTRGGLPQFAVPEGETPFSYLCHLVYQGARERYHPITPAVCKQLAHELDVIQKLGLAGYFLIVWDIVRFCKERDILAQGRGSAANSVVCFCLDITNVDPIKLDLLFERFLSEERAGTPDIDLDVANKDREEVIQYLYQKYDRRHAGMVCEVITYRGRSAIRDVGKALGLSLDQVDEMAKRAEGRGSRNESRGSSVEGRGWSVQSSSLFQALGSRPSTLDSLCDEIQDFPRHLGIHVGGMIITARPLVEIVPVERATMPGRTVVQWDKDSVEEAGLIKIDVLGLGMLSLIQDCLKLVKQHRGVEIDLAKLPYDDPEVYDMLCRADTVGVFQVESRAQMATLPRLKPRCFYDIVVEIALIRPGPIQGEMVHPYLRRRQGLEPVTYPHPKLEPVLRKTLGVPLFQEQGMKLAIAAAGFSPGKADLLRKAMGHKRSRQQMDALCDDLIRGMAENGIPQEAAMRIFKQLAAFADYGFPESHAASFAHIVYASAYLKRYYPAEFYCALLNNQPMGFYQPSVIVGDARRHGIETLPVDVNKSRVDCTVEGDRVRLGYRYVRGIG
ncbi:MAG: error-prone DNA polymerase, partial [Chloroflexi bacterium]|nr:error-prone DNA polymerase [Chloroflexota bacterium]